MIASKEHAIKGARREEWRLNDKLRWQYIYCWRINGGVNFRQYTWPEGNLINQSHSIDAAASTLDWQVEMWWKKEKKKDVN